MHPYALSAQALHGAPQAKRKRQHMGSLKLVVAGCVAAQEGAALLRRVPELDLVMGPHHAHRCALQPAVAYMLGCPRLRHQCMLRCPPADYDRMLGGAPVQACIPYYLIMYRRLCAVMRPLPALLDLKVILSACDDHQCRLSTVVLGI